MLRFLVCAFFALLGGAVIASNQIYDSNKDPYAFEGLINETIEGIRDDLPEPIVIENLTITVPEDIDILTGSADLSNLEISGVKAFQVPALSFTLVGMRLNFTFVLPSLNINTDYWGDLVLLDLVPIYGDGKANIHLEDLEIVGSAQASLSGGISVSGLRIQVYLGASTFDIHGALDNEDFSAILSELLNDAVTSLIDNHQEAISNIVSPIVEELLNAILAGANTDTTAAPARATAPVAKV
ncbi:hypothetical protein Zmor_026704 [Zophobas morio]|uniref:Uncharacterized protein n=1 Tax=Zophobas morio TaxID=2755281 RepID=A0AA38HUH4_9CUCU|nr:hypothetical protein Zmor_026704 [Zophobas morio]